MKQFVFTSQYHSSIHAHWENGKEGTHRPLYIALVKNQPSSQENHACLVCLAFIYWSSVWSDHIALVGSSHQWSVSNQLQKCNYQDIIGVSFHTEVKFLYFLYQTPPPPATSSFRLPTCGLVTDRKHTFGNKMPGKSWIKLKRVAPPYQIQNSDTNKWHRTN